MKNPIIAPSVLSADFGNLARDVEMINQSVAEWIHIDVMDGHFVPNISLGFPIIKAIQKTAKKIMDVHLMVSHPDPYIIQFREVGADNITVHMEACTHLHRTIQLIHSTGAKVGVALNPHTPVDSLREIIADIDLVCLMSVNPGFGGQKFITSTLDKIKRTRALIEKYNSNALIEIDGGVTLENAGQILASGADVLVAGNTVFGSSDPRAMISQLFEMNAVNS